MSFNILLVGIVIAFGGVNASTEDWKYDLKLDPNDDYHVFWNYNQVNITIEVQVRTKGYVGFGFSPKGGMKGADIVTGWVKDSKVFFQDRYATENAEPIIDESQDYELLAGYENETHTVLRFQRKLDTCDDHDIVFANDTMRFIYAWRDEDPITETGLEYHGPINRGTRVVKPSHSKLNANTFNLTGDVYVWDLEMPKLQVPPVQTFYFCDYFKFPAYPNKRQRVGWELIMDPNHSRLVHHIAVFKCGAEFVAKYEYNRGDIDNNCTMQCYESILLSAVGQTVSVLPPEIGAAIGQIGKPTYYMFSVHYENPGLLKGISDQTTLRIYLTEKLRKHESGVFDMSLNMFDLTTVIPPKQPSFIEPISCPSACTKQLFPDGVNIFSYAFHGHLALRKGRVRHFRDGVELPPLFQDNNWDFANQEPIELSNPVKVLPGDYMLGECEYDTTDRTNFTVGGLQNKDEMCIIMMEYYPAANVSSCLKFGSQAELNKIFHVDQQLESALKFKPSDKMKYALHEYLVNYNTSTLTEEDISNIRRIQGFDTSYTFCLPLNDNRLLYYKAEYPNDTTVFYQAPLKKSCRDSI